MADDNRQVPHKSSDQGFASENYDEQTAQEARSKGGQASASKQDMSELGRKGGEATQQSENKHNLTTDEQSEGGKASSSQQDMSELGRKGGSQ